MAADPATKLRTVLDYVPCEACLAEPVDHQELLCSICRRLDRQVAVRIAVRTTVLIERPSEPSPAEPVVISPPPAAAPPSLPTATVVFVPEGASPPPPASDLEVLVTPLLVPPPTAPVPTAPAEAAPDFDDIVSFTAPTDSFEYVPPRARAPAPPPQAPLPEVEVEPIPQDDFVFRPPPAEAEAEPAPAPEEEAPIEDWMPSEEVAVQREEQPDDAWARAGVPADAARALVASGYGSPDALRGEDADAVVTRVRDIAGRVLSPDDVRRWQGATT